MDKYWIRALFIAGLVVMIKPQVGLLMLLCMFGYLFLVKN